MSSTAPVELASDAAPEDVLRWAYETFPRLAIVASFQADS
jgi:3'-phosphoadenosine 5'-phosphosulfate sulfotransferase (PAPS reductase)/FAD synthetase